MSGTILGFVVAPNRCLGSGLGMAGPGSVIPIGTVTINDPDSVAAPTQLSLADAQLLAAEGFGSLGGSSGTAILEPSADNS